jgi:hypothetical protein
MTATDTQTFAYAIDIREDGTGARRGVGLLVPSARYAATASGDGQHTVARTLSDDAWRDIDAWIAESNAALPKRPAALSAAVTANALGIADATGVTAHRFAAVPVRVDFDRDLGALAAELLPPLSRW